MTRTISTATSFLSHLNAKVAVFLAQFVAALTFYFMNSYIPLFINKDLQYPLIEATRWAGIYQLVGAGVAAVAAPFTGYLYDRFGLKRIWILILCENVVAYAGLALSSSVIQVILFRALQGVCAISTIVFAFSASLASGRELKKTLSLQLAAMTAGQLIGPGIGGIIASLVGYRSTFVAAALLYIAMIPMAFIVKTSRTKITSSEKADDRLDLKTILPDAFSLILVYMCMYFVTPIIPWFLSSLGVPYEQLIISTAIVTMLNGLAFAVATSFLTRVITDRILPVLPLLSAGIILATAFSQYFYQFLILQIMLITVLAGIPPNLFGGRSQRRGIAMGLLNSARFIGQAIGPFIATTVLGEGTSPRPLYVFVTMSTISIVAAASIYVTQMRRD